MKSRKEQTRRAWLATLEKQTGFLTIAAINPLRYRLTGDSQGVDSILKQVGKEWILVVASFSPQPVTGVDFELQEPGTIAAAEKLEYRHDSKAAKRSFQAAPVLVRAPDRIPLDLAAHLEGTPAATPAPGSD